MSWLFSDFQYKLLALVVAVLLWSLSQGTSSIERGFDVPVAIQERPDNLVVTRRSADAINIRVRGTRAALRSLSGENLEYAVNLSGAKSGRADFEVDLVVVTRRNASPTQGGTLYGSTSLFQRIYHYPKQTPAPWEQWRRSEGIPRADWFGAGFSADCRSCLTARGSSCSWS